ncbi:hypothetical protein [Kutzneria sp. 744]|uniref:hypothetical protein n=1 Tax=Kutzneria sp. (strain 744) TaxID=345341 RepID=UPI0004BA8DCC|nr:hypothetical protein [Kutzneria sp. 744]
MTMPAPGQPPAGNAAVLITRPSGATDTQLIPADYSPSAHTISAQVNHLSDFWSAFLDFTKVGAAIAHALAQMTGLVGTRPDCAGASAPGLAGSTLSFSGDYSAKADPAAWPCVRMDNGSAAVTLTSNSPLPWRIRVAPTATLDATGTTDLGKAAILAVYDALATSRPHTEGLLVRGQSVTYRFAAVSLPATVQGQADPGFYLGMVLVFGLQEAMDAFGIDLGDLSKDADALSCLSDAIDATGLAAHPDLGAIVSLGKAVLSCLGPVAGDHEPGPVKVVVGILGSGLSLALGGVEGALLSALNKDTFTIGLRRVDPPPSATRVVNIVAADRAGAPAAGYGVTSQNDEVFDCYPSPAAVGPDIVACGPSAAEADICWVNPNRVTLLCGDQPWAHTLRQATSSTLIGSITATSHPDPWGLELSDGAKCRICRRSRKSPFDLGRAHVIHQAGRSSLR